MPRVPSLIIFLYTSPIWAADIAHTTPGPGNGSDAMMADSPFSVYTAGAVGYVIIVMFLVIALLAGAILTVNIAMMTKREQDYGLGGIEPSEVGFLANERWKNVHAIRRVLPPEVDEDQTYSFPLGDHAVDENTLLREEDMYPDWKRLFEKPKRRSA